MAELKRFDDRKHSNDVYTLFHHIRKKMNECDKHDIDLNVYVDKDRLYRILEILDCCLEHKDSKYIARKE